MNANLYHVTKFPLYLSFTVHYFYTKISGFTQFFIPKNSFLLFLCAHFLLREILGLNLTFAVRRIREAWTIYYLLAGAVVTESFSYKKIQEKETNKQHKHHILSFCHLNLCSLLHRLWLFIAITFLDGPKSCSSFPWNTDLNVGWMKTLGKFILLLVFRLESVLVCVSVSSLFNTEQARRSRPS